MQKEYWGPMEAETEVLHVLHRQWPLPANCLIVDTETSGFSNNDVFVDVGWVQVSNYQIVNSCSLLLDWSQDSRVSNGFVIDRLGRLQETYSASGRPFYYPWERLTREGVPPAEALFVISKIIYDYLSTGRMIVGHGLYRFDRRMFKQHGERFMNGWQIPWQDNSILDTGLIEKAMQANIPPFRCETLEEWNTRIARKNIKGLKWSLEEHCVPKYDLAARYCLDMRAMHTAEFDCRLIYALLRFYSELAGVIDGQVTSAQVSQTVLGGHPAYKPTDPQVRGFGSF